MIKIIENTRIIKCGCCYSKFSYQNEDVILCPREGRIVTCPVCMATDSIDDMN